MIKDIKSRLASLPHTTGIKTDIAVFLAGFAFDFFTLSEIDDLFSITQQIVYLAFIGVILYFEFLESMGLSAVHEKLKRLWQYRRFAVHFLLGSLLSLYSLFFLKSSSLFSTGIFTLILVGLLIANELKRVQKSDVDLKVGLYIVCLFSFYSILIPILLGFVGQIPFWLSHLATSATIAFIFWLLTRRILDRKFMLRKLVAPGVGTLAVFMAFYLFGWIPPVPLSIEELGVYHGVEKSGNQYILYHERPYWKFWQNGDEDFVAEPGDKIFVFTRIFSPARFSDSVFVHWMYKDPKLGWQSTDRIPMRITGGRKGGYRGFAVKQNYAPGEWRVSIETTDGREIGRMYFTVTKTVMANPAREFVKDVR